MTLWQEIRRRKVFQVGAVYAIVAWAIAQIVDVVNEPLNLPAWFDTAIIVMLACGFPVAILLAWAYDLTPEGIRKTDDLDAARTPPEPKAALAAIAVFPFKNLSESSPHGFLADAVPMELQSLLCRVNQLRIVSGQSSIAHSSSNKDLRSIASDLDVQYVISGSIAQVGEKIRIMVELNDAANDSMLWSDTYNADADDILKVQQDIAESIVSAFGGERLRAEINRASSATGSELMAWQLVHKAKAYLLDYKAETVAAAVPLLEKSVELSPEYAEAHATLGLVIAEMTLNGISEDPTKDRAIAINAADRATEIAPRDPVVLRAAGPVHAYCGDYKTATELLRRAVQLAPYDLGAWGYLGWSLVASGDSVDLQELNNILDRLLSIASNHPGHAYWQFHKSVASACEELYEESLQYAKRSTTEQPRFALAWMHSANVLGKLGRSDDAQSAARRCVEINPHMTAAFYAELMSVLTDKPRVIACRTSGLVEAKLLN